MRSLSAVVSGRREQKRSKGRENGISQAVLYPSEMFIGGIELQKPDYPVLGGILRNVVFCLNMAATCGTYIPPVVSGCSWSQYSWRAQKLMTHDTTQCKSLRSNSENIVNKTKTLVKGLVVWLVHGLEGRGVTGGRHTGLWQYTCDDCIVVPTCNDFH